MPFIFVDDGYPEADDYASNYEWVETAAVKARKDAARRRRACGKCPPPETQPWWQRLRGRGVRPTCACMPASA